MRTRPIETGGRVGGPWGPSWGGSWGDRTGTGDTQHAAIVSKSRKFP